ncbi:Gamma-tubulin complex component 3 [Entophlyctis luteolus]|nr:Gamma-tubulin complex component 3 [Entophlyctis luteolus]
MSAATAPAPPAQVADAVARNLRRLVDAFAKGRESSEAFAFGLRILTSRIAPSVAVDSPHVVDLIKKKREFSRIARAFDLIVLWYAPVVKRDKSMKDTLEFSALAKKLSHMPLEAAFAVSGIKPIPPPPAFEPLPQDTDVPPAAESPSPPPEPFIRGPCTKYYIRPVESGSSSLQVSEVELLRDMLFIFQDIDGKYVRYNAVLGTYTLDANIWMPSSALENLSRLAEVGWLYRRIRENLEAWKMDTEDNGLIRQGFCSAIQKELALHFQLIAQLEDQFTKELITPSPETKPADFAAKGLSLKRLLVWIQEPVLKLRLILVLVEMSAGLRGGALLSMVHGYTNHGDPYVQTFVDTLLKQISAPFFQTLKRWIYEGELSDNFQEFFVFYDKNAGTENLWRTQYLLRYDMIPAFLNRGIVKKSNFKCYLIGKSLNFIRYCCFEEEFVVRRTQELVSSPPGFLEYGDMTALESSINEAYKRISSHILDLMFGKYKLLTHLRALKKYLLLGQGDFVQNLMDKLGTDLSKPAANILRHNLTGTLESSIRSSNAQHDDPDVLRRLDVRLLEISSGDSGWDVFTLDYHVDPPIDTVFMTQSMGQYMKLFTFLWRLKRVEFSLSISWRRGVTEFAAFRKLREVGPHFHFCSITLNEMIHFTYQLQYYILFEVLENSWDELNVYISKRTGDLDQLIGAHNKYLNNITSRGLLAATMGSQNMFLMLVGLFDTILKFQLKMESLVALANELHLESNKRDVREFENRLMNRISLSENNFAGATGVSDGRSKLSLVGENLRTIAGEYHVSVCIYILAGKKA